MFKYEMHVHSGPCSGWGDDIGSHIEDLVEKGFSGMVITNHFIRGDTRIDRTLPWKDFVDRYRDDFEKGKKIAEGHDFDLLFGIEEHIGGGKEILIYGITPDFILQNPCLAKAELEEYAKLVHEAGGLVYQSHPYRVRDYITDPGPVHQLELIDGIEVFNACNTAEENDKAVILARQNSLKCIAGSDAHAKGSAGRAGILTELRIHTNEQLVNTLRNGCYTILK